MDRLGDDLEFRSVYASIPKQIGSCSLSREEYDFATWTLCPDENRCFDTGHAGHDYIADEGVRLEGAERGKDFLPAVDRTSFKTRVVEDRSQSIRNDAFVVSYEYSPRPPVGLCSHLHAVDPWSV